MSISIPSRLALRLAACGIATALITSGMGAQELFRYPVVGGITHNTAEIRVWLNAPAEIAIEYGAAADLAGALRTSTVNVRAEEDNTASLSLQGLMAGSRYYYRVVDRSGTPRSAIHSFKTFPEPGADAPVTILFGSCQQSRLTDLGKTFDVAAGLGGDFFIQLGDWGYPDRLVPGYPGTPGSIRESYALRLDTGYAFARRVLSQMGLAYVWDDHDYTGNNSDGTADPALKTALLQGYSRYLPHYPLPNASAGIWQSFRMGNVEVFMIDDRSQRNPVEAAFQGNNFAPPPGHSMLAGYPVAGTDQRTWLLDAIRRSTARWKVLVSQVFFNPASAPAIPLTLLAGRRDAAEEFADKWVGFPADVDSMKALFAEGHGRNFLVISGDAHTNLYDDGSHSIVPEFMVGNLDKENSNLFAMLTSYGFNVWTAGQPGTESTVGRIRVETSPTHRLIVESFDENGKLTLTHTMTDASASAPAEKGSAWTLRSVRVTGKGKGLRLEIANALARTCTLRVFNLEGKVVAEGVGEPSGDGVLNVALPELLPSGSYLGELRSGGEVLDFRFELVR